MNCGSCGKIMHRETGQFQKFCEGYQDKKFNWYTYWYIFATHNRCNLLSTQLFGKGGTPYGYMGRGGFSLTF